MAKLPRVAILGRPNVGKSTLFNRLIGQRRALVGDEPGMTRDRLYAPADWMGKRFEVIDTGGMVPAGHDLIVGEIFRQAGVAIEEAAQLILVVDGRAGILPLDEELSQMLRRTGKPVSLAVNKVDMPQHETFLEEFRRLGFRDIFPISAEHALGVDILLDHVTRDFPVDDSPEVIEVKKDRDPATENLNPLEGRVVNVAIIGRPNVGKSTLLNRLMNEERSIVTPIAGTTRDAVDAEFELNGQRFRLIDTAGIRRKGKTDLHAEKLSVMQARKHLERADVALLMIDAVEGVTAMDAHIGGYAHESGRSVVIVVNKWDAIHKTPTSMEEYTETIRRRMKYLSYASIIFISAQKGTRLGKLMEIIIQVATARFYRVTTSEMNRFLKEVDFERSTSPANRPMRIYYMTQGAVAPPTFIVFTNRATKLHFSFERFLENRIRERWGFPGTPINIKSRQSR
ncbi:MAG TPA: ribosome biogenesis GTPase Der [Terriglobia bacterium]|nr:ribosome biogenesis GTPase Der [Terriglobia bacterium]